MAPSQSPIISAQYNHLRGAHRIGGGQNGGQNGSSNNSSPRHLHHGQNGHSPSLGDYLVSKKRLFFSSCQCVEIIPNFNVYYYAK